MAPASSFLDLMAVHARLEEAFLRHQEALLALDLTGAEALLERYESDLLAHMTREEEAMLPLYTARAGRIPGGPVELFLGEHRKMREFLRSFRADLHRLRREPTPTLRRLVIALLDRQAMYKHLVEHHDLRERNILYPALDRVTSEEERSRLLASVPRP